MWLFPWSAYLPGCDEIVVPAVNRAGRVRLMALCWIGVVMVFFTFSTTQEYYSMPIYPALALLIGSALPEGGTWVRNGTRVLIGICGATVCRADRSAHDVLALPHPGEISQALTQNPELYTLSMGHMSDLTLAAFAYLKLPLALAAFAFGFGLVLLLVYRANRFKAASRSFSSNDHFLPGG